MQKIKYKGGRMRKKLLMFVMLISIVTNLNAGDQSQRKADCDEGDAWACFQYARNAFGSSDYIKQKYYNRAWKLFPKQCNEGYGEACFSYGDLLRTGNFKNFGLKKDLPKAAQYFVKGCEFNQKVSCSYAGLSFDLGNGIPKNIEKARKYYKKSCELGYDKGCKQYNTVK